MSMEDLTCGAFFFRLRLIPSAAGGNTRGAPMIEYILDDKTRQTIRYMLDVFPDGTIVQFHMPFTDAVAKEPKDYAEANEPWEQVMDGRT